MFGSVVSFYGCSFFHPPIFSSHYFSCTSSGSKNDHGRGHSTVKISVTSTYTLCYTHRFGLNLSICPKLFFFSPTLATYPTVYQPTDGQTREKLTNPFYLGRLVRLVPRCCELKKKKKKKKRNRIRRGVEEYAYDFGIIASLDLHKSQYRAPITKMSFKTIQSSIPIIQFLIYPPQPSPLSSTSPPSVTLTHISPSTPQLVISPNQPNIFPCQQTRKKFRIVAVSVLHLPPKPQPHHIEVCKNMRYWIV